MSFIWSLYSPMWIENEIYHAAMSEINSYIEIHRPDEICYSIFSFIFNRRARNFWGVNFFPSIISVLTLEPNEIRKHLTHLLVSNLLKYLDVSTM